jgi:ribonuclease T2
MPCLLVLAGCHVKPPASAASHFGLYLLAMTWTPSVCCATHDEQCADVRASLTLHGLWPNYTDDQSRGLSRAWPQYCGGYAHCEQAEDASCAPEVAVPADLAPFAPGYVRGALATHEWSKHGSCTRLSAADYFAAELAAIRSIPALEVPGAVVGHDTPRTDLQRSFGVAADSVVLGCDAHCRLTQVGFCFAKDVHDRPTAPIACTANVTRSDYDNGCATRGCDRVVVAAPGACGTVDGATRPK